MADVNYVITIKSDSDGGDADGGEKKRIARKSDGEGGGGFVDFVKNHKKQVIRFAATNFALKYADLAITTHINRVELRTGNALLQEKMNYNYNIAKNVALSGAAIAYGAFSGNPLAVIGGVMSIANIGIQQAIAQENINISRAVESIGLEQARIRAGTARRY